MQNMTGSSADLPVKQSSYLSMPAKPAERKTDGRETPTQIVVAHGVNAVTTSLLSSTTYQSANLIQLHQAQIRAELYQPFKGKSGEEMAQKWDKKAESLEAIAAGLESEMSRSKAPDRPPPPIPRTLTPGLPTSVPLQNIDSTLTQTEDSIGEKKKEGGLMKKISRIFKRSSIEFNKAATVPLPSGNVLDLSQKEADYAKTKDFISLKQLY